MGLEKLGTSLGKEIIAWTKASGKSLLATRPVKVNTKGLKYVNNLNIDTLQIKHRNLTSYLKKELRSPKHVEQILEQCPETSRHIGSLPNSWLDNIPKADRAEYTKRISDLFSDFAKQTSLSKEIGNETFEKVTTDFAKKLQCYTNQNVEVSFLGKGTIGRTFKIKANNEEFVVKTFYPDPLKYGYYSSHGKGAEICNAAYASKHAIKGEFADFYFGKFARQNDNDGFLITKFINFKNARMSNIKNKTLDGLLGKRVISGDQFNKDNCVLDTILDYGAVETSRMYNDKQQKLIRLIKDAINTSNKSEFNNILQKYKGSDLDYVLKRIKGDFIEHFEDFEIACKLGVYQKPSSSIVSKIITSNTHNKLYRLLDKAIKAGDRKEYEAIIAHYKDSKALEEILKYYNSGIEAKVLNNFNKQVSYVENERLLSTLENFGLYSPQV